MTEQKVQSTPRSTDCANSAILNAKNYDGLKHLDVENAKIFVEHELPEGYHIIKCIGKGAFGRCFLIEKKLQRVAPKRGNIRDTEDIGVERVESDSRCLQMILKVVEGNIIPRCPVRFYKACSAYTLMISHKAFPLELVNLKFIIGILKYRHVKHEEVHGDLHPGNMMYFPKDVTMEMWREFIPNADSVWENWPHPSHIVQAILDFQYDWFSMEDEQITSIIDADMGGKIGAAKILVNHLHHDPRNHTWQISDDLVGLMNWVVRKSDYSLRGDPKRGIVYDITLESLKILYEYITDTYEGMDSKFIFTKSIFATGYAEKFNLKLVRGKCYLDELLDGQFLKFQSFKGSYSLCSSAAEATSCVKVMPRTVVQAVPMSQQEVYEAFCGFTSSQEFYRTLKEVIELLVDSSLRGGVIFVIVDKKHKDELLIQPLDEGALTSVCRQHSISAHDPAFKHIVGSFCAHSGTDRWTAALLSDLASSLARESQDDLPNLASLENQPKDGAFVLSRKGTVLAASSRLGHTAQHLEMRKVDGTCVGTRHAASLSTAEWMRSKKIDGAVFVKSDAGGVHVLIPEHNEDVPRLAFVHVDDPGWTGTSSSHSQSDPVNDVRQNKLCCRVF